MAEEKEEDVIVLEPSSAWQLDYGEDKCRLVRKFGTAGNEHLLYFEQYAPGASFTLVAAGPALKAFQRNRLVSIEFAGNANKIESRGWGEMELFGPAIYKTDASLSPPPKQEDRDADEEPGLPRIDVTQLSKGGGVTYAAKGRRIVFATGNLAAPLGALSDCGTQFVADWGLDLEQHRNATRRTKFGSNMRSVVRSIIQSYPRKALDKGLSGTVKVLVFIDQLGAVTDCRALQVTQFVEVEQRLCEEMKRAIFVPALDRDGAPMKSYYITDVLYEVN